MLVPEQPVLLGAVPVEMLVGDVSSRQIVVIGFRFDFESAPLRESGVTNQLGCGRLTRVGGEEHHVSEELNMPRQHVFMV